MTRYRFVSPEEARARFTEYVSQHGYRTTAKTFNVSESYVLQVRTGARTVGPAIQAGLGLVPGFGEPTTEDA